ncbi:MAG: dehydrogenase, partial [Verrucomicrobia bacterium]|nr:dehydrogenase [Verrucomicrobiota bacterium]
MSTQLEVGLTRDFLTADGKLIYKDIGLSVLDAAKGVRHRFLDRHEPTITPDLLRDVDAVISLTPKYTAASFTGLERFAAVVRFGVGYDMVDVKACTDADVLLCITAGAVNHSVAEATIA